MIMTRVVYKGKSWASLGPCAFWIVFFIKLIGQKRLAGLVQQTRGKFLGMMESLEGHSVARQLHTSKVVRVKCYKGTLTCGQHWTACPSNTLASSLVANSTAAFQSSTLVGSLSRACSRTLLWFSESFSSSAVRIHNLKDKAVQSETPHAYRIQSSHKPSLSKKVLGEVDRKLNCHWDCDLAF